MGRLRDELANPALHLILIALALAAIFAALPEARETPEWPP